MSTGKKGAKNENKKGLGKVVTFKHKTGGGWLAKHRKDNIIEGAKR